jgi:hypothetical protein
MGTIFCTLIFLSRLHELWSLTLKEWCDATLLLSRTDLREFLLQFSEEDQRWPTAPLFIMNISPLFGEFTASLHHILPIHNITINSNSLFVNFHWTFTFCWETVWWNIPRIWRDFGSVLPFQTRLTQIKPVLPLLNEHGSQVKDQGRRQYCHTKRKKFPYQPTCDVSLLPRHTS